MKNALEKKKKRRNYYLKEENKMKKWIEWNQKELKDKKKLID
jgi:hypothetical protein